MAGQFGAWTPIGAEKTATGYEIAWKSGSADLYTVWNDRQQRQLHLEYRRAVSGSSTLESLETSFHQDLNGDGQIGVAVATVIESNGATSLTEVGNIFILMTALGLVPR